MKSLYLRFADEALTKSRHSLAAGFAPDHDAWEHRVKLGIGLSLFVPQLLNQPSKCERGGWCRIIDWCWLTTSQLTVKLLINWIIYSFINWHGVLTRRRHVLLTGRRHVVLYMQQTAFATNVAYLPPVVFSYVPYQLLISWFLFVNLDLVVLLNVLSLFIMIMLKEHFMNLTFWHY